MPNYGTFKYGTAMYGAVGSFPVSTDFDIFDFCYPTEAQMLNLFAYSAIKATRSLTPPHLYLDGNDDLCMLSDDDVISGMRITTSVPPQFTVQFSILPTALPADFSDPENHRFFVGAYNSQGRMLGLLLSENGGVALAPEGDGPATPLPDTADLFDAGSEYYVFRIVADDANARGHLYVTKKSELASIGHQLRCTFSLQTSPVDQTVDFLTIETLGSAGAPTEICLDCIRLSSQVLIPNKRPVAVTELEEVTPLTQYAGFDSSSSYDPEGLPVTHFWTITAVPEDSTLRVEGTGTTPAHASGYTNTINGSAGDFSVLNEGDLLFIGEYRSRVIYVSSDESSVRVIDHVFPASATVGWYAITQSVWGGNAIASNVTVVLQAASDPSLLTPSGADQYLIQNGVGIWLNLDNMIATWSGVSWSYASPETGDALFALDTDKSYKYKELAVSPPPYTGLWYEQEPAHIDLAHLSGRATPVAAFLPDMLGLYRIEIVVNDGDLDSLPVEVLLSVRHIDSALGLTPDLSFLWNYLSSFWDLVEDKEKIDTLWSAFVQIASSDLLALWQNAYSKSIKTIQSLYQRQWLDHSPYYEEPSYIDLPATMQYGINAAGYASSPTPSFPADPEYSYQVDSGELPAGVSSDHILVLAGIGYRILRTEGDVISMRDALPATVPQFWMIRSHVTSRFSDFSKLGVSPGDQAIFEVSDDDQITDIPCYVFGARQAFLVFDNTPLASYLSDPSITVMFKGLLRSSRMQVNDLVISMPRLQEVINLQGVEGAPDPLTENIDFRVVATLSDLGQSVTWIEFLNAFRTQLAYGLFGSTTANDRFVSTEVSFTDLLGDSGTDISDAVLVINGVAHRLKQVISDTELELFDPSIESGLSDQSWTLRSIDVPPETLFAEVTYLDNRPAIEANFGRLVGFTLDDLNARTDNLEYLSVVKGLWYTYWFARTPNNIRTGAQILLGLPFAVKSGTVLEIASPFDATKDRVLISDDEDTNVFWPYFYPTAVGIALSRNTGLALQVGDHVEQFDPISAGVVVNDWESDPDWAQAPIGTGDLAEVQKVHFFEVKVSSTVFDLTNLVFMVGFLRKIKPASSSPFFIVLKSIEDQVQVDDEMVMGPGVPAVGTYPDTWDAFPTPSGWVGSPGESPRSAVPPSGLFTDVPLMNFGGLHLADVPGWVPDGWEDGTHAATRGERTFSIGDTDYSGKYVHLIGGSLVPYVVDLFASTDGHMEAIQNPGAPGSFWTPIGSPTTLTKSTGTYRTTPRSLEVESAVEGEGCYQDFPAAIDTGFQVAVTGWVYMVDGQAHFQLLDQDGSSVLAELRRNLKVGEWSQFVLHAWAVSAYAANLRFRILTGPAGGHFFVDSVEAFAKNPPWDQAGIGKQYGGRTGGYTDFGGLPDEHLQFRIHEYYVAPAIPLVGSPILVIGAASSQDEELMVSGPSPGAPPGSWPNPGDDDVWDGPYGPRIVDWTSGTHGAGWAPPNAGFVIGSTIPAGWYTRITRNNKFVAKPLILNISDP